MRLSGFCFILLLSLFLFSPVPSRAQASLSGINDSVITLPCGVFCAAPALSIPHLRSTEDYIVNKIPYSPYPYTSLLGNPLTQLYDDDAYSTLLPIGFKFCFYDTIFSNVVLGSNGLLTFDRKNADCINAFSVDPPIPSAGSDKQCSQNDVYYPRAAIMGVYSDLNPQLTESPSDRRIEWRVEGVAPLRRFIGSWYHIGVYGNICGKVNPTTFQIVLYEGTGVIDIYVEQKLCAASAVQQGPNNLAILGIQNWDRDKGLSPPGRNAKNWTATHEAYRFIPAGTTSRFVSAEVRRLDNTLVGAVIATPNGANKIDLTLPSLCPVNASEKYVLRTTYTSCVDPAGQLVINDTFTIRKSNLMATAIATPTACGTPATGTIKVSIPAGNGVAPYHYSLDGGLTSQTSDEFKDLPSGNYTVTVTDNAGTCTSTVDIVVSSTGTLDVALSVTGTSCPGAKNGSIDIGANGTGQISYQLAPNGPWLPGTIINGLADGAYTLNVQDAAGCRAFNLPAIVPAGNRTITGTAQTTQTSCTGVDNGKIVLTANQPGNYEYSRDDGQSWQPSNNFLGLAAGTYHLRIREVNAGCITNTIVATVTAGQVLTSVVNKTDPLCNAMANGSISVQVPTSGTGPFDYSINNGAWQASGNFAGLVAGNYAVSYRDIPSGCIGKEDLILLQPPVLAAATIIENVKCNGAADGSITINASGGTPAYTYSLNGGAYQAGNVFTLTNGNYSIAVKDNNACVLNKAGIIITQPTAIQGSIGAITNAGCALSDNGSITVNASGGTGPYQYSLDGTNFLSTTAVLAAAPGTYNVTIKDAAGCSKQLPAATVALTNTLVLTPMTDPAPACEGTAVGLQLVSNANSFAWSPSVGLNDAAISNPQATPASTALYTVTATLGRCSKTDDVNVTVLPAPIPDAGPGGIICSGQNFQLHASGGVQYNWSPVTNLDNSLIPDPEVVSPLKTTTYSLHVTDANNCRSINPDRVTVTVTAPIQIKVTPADTVVYEGAQFKLIASSEAIKYTWTPATSLSDPGISDPIVTAPATGTRIDYTVVGKTNENCRGEGHATVRVYKGPDVYMPSAFSPNGDGKNELFTPFTVGIKKLEYFMVFNRWGQLIFSTTTLRDGWDGKHAGIPQGAGVYVWQLRASTETGVVINRQGTVTLVR